MDEIPYDEVIMKKVLDGSEFYKKYFIEEFLVQKYVHELEILK